MSLGHTCIHCNSVVQHFGRLPLAAWHHAASLHHHHTDCEVQLTSISMHYCVCCAVSAGAQALVAWTLQRADPSVKLSMVAEEDAADLT
jgi:hypothetical protein